MEYPKEEQNREIKRNVSVYVLMFAQYMHNPFFNCMFIRYTFEVAFNIYLVKINR